MPLVPGTVLKDQLVIDRELGRGGMGVVWLATHRGLGAPVVVKVLEAATVEPEALARFDREARACARIDSVHVVRVFDVGQTAEGRPFIVMELLRGEDLKERIGNAGRLSVAQTTVVVEQLCDALERAHALGIVHRDLKPANIFLLQGERTFIKVLDFGIAKLEADSGAGLTATDALMGTPYYMSPEQFIDPRSVDHRTDLWSAGVIVYACLTGQLPFQAETVGALALLVHQGDFAPPSTLVPSLPPSLDAWFRGVLNPDIEQRPKTARAFATSFVEACSAAAPRSAPALGQPTLEPMTLPSTTHAPTASRVLAPPPVTAVAPVAPRERRTRSKVVAAVLVAALGGAVTASYLGYRRLWKPTSTKTPKASASAVGSVAVPADPKQAVGVLNELCEKGDASACARLGDLLSRQAEVKDDARAVKAYERACESKDHRACAEAGLLISRGRGAPKDRVRGAELYKRGCDGAEATSCTRWAQAHVTGAGVRKDFARAAALHQKACDAGSAADCAFFAELVQSGNGAQRDLVIAVDLFRRACDAGDAGGCAGLAVMHYNGLGVAKDVVAAAGFARRACDAGDIRGCLAFTGNAEVAIAKADADRIVPLLARACDDFDGEACTGLGSMYERGTGVPLDVSRAVELYRLGCDRDDAYGCFSFGVMHWHGLGVPVDMARGVLLFQQACDGDVLQACYSVAHAYETGNGLARNDALAASLLTTTCQRHHAEACVAIGLHLVGVTGDHKLFPADDAKAAENFSRGCALRDPKGCMMLGAMYAEGRGVFKDLPRAVALYDEACNMPYFRACTELARFYAKGEGVVKDMTRAKAILHKACASGEQEACTALQSL